MMFNPCDTTQLRQNVKAWHDEMTAHIRSNDPFNHCVSSSMGSIVGDFNSKLHHTLFTNLDFVKQHLYGNIQKAKSKEQMTYLLLLEEDTGHTAYPAKPFHMEEFGFGSKGPKPQEKDPYGFDVHNTLWASMFSSAMGPGSHWWWYYLSSNRLFKYYKPLLTFCSKLPIPSDSFRPFTTGTIEDNLWLVFPNNIQTYYMKNATEDTIYGWCQDTAFAYQSLRALTDSIRFPGSYNPTNTNPNHFIDSMVFDPGGYVYTMNEAKKPGPSSNNNTIALPISNQPVGTLYSINWYDSETGLFCGSSSDRPVQMDGSGNKFLSFQFPSSIRDYRHNSVTNTFGDVVFVIHLMSSEHTHHEDKQ